MIVPADTELSTGWRLDDRDGLTVAFCDALLGVSGVVHAFSTRRVDGRDDFDLGSADDDGEPWDGRRRRFARVSGLRAPLAAPRQVHGVRLIGIDRAAADGPAPEADGVLAMFEQRDVGVPAVRAADCVPILLAEVAGRFVAAVHAGWRGTAGRIAERAVEALVGAGSDPGDLVAALGPAIGRCCYEVGAEVRDAVGGGEATGDGRFLDLREANRLQLQKAGIPADSVHVAPWCTRCRKDLFYTHRGDPGGAGRMMACVGWAAPEGALP